MQLADLAHWNAIDTFKPEEAACLIAGFDLNSIGGALFSGNRPNSSGITAIPTYQRMNAEYDHARGWYSHQLNPQEGYLDGPRPDHILRCVAMENYDTQKDVAKSESFHEFYYRLQDDRLSGFTFQRFSRAELARWLQAVDVSSAYQFAPAIGLSESTAVLEQTQELEIDPSDLPPELQVANMAYRAIQNGHGDQAKTFKNRLIDYLKVNFKDLKPEAIRRIAVVANPDKSPGRKNRDRK